MQILIKLIEPVHILRNVFVHNYSCGSDFSWVQKKLTGYMEEDSINNSKYDDVNDRSFIVSLYLHNLYLAAADVIVVV
jgi:hypothetical protein